MKHPNISDTFYQKLEPPTDLDDAHIRMSCHQHSIDDFQLQIEMCEIELAMFCDGETVLPYQADKMDELEQKKLKLLGGKRFHQNARHAYWYYTAKAER